MVKKEDNQLNVNNKTEVKPETKKKSREEEKVWVIKYLHDKKIPLSRMRGVLTFLKVSESADIDREWADEQLGKYKSRVGGGL